MDEKNIYVGNSILQESIQEIHGEIILQEDENYYRISNYDRMPPFLMNVVSSSDLWMFISSNGALTAGRKNPDSALFPYYTDDRIHDSFDITGSKTIVLIKKDDKFFLWEPFSQAYRGLYNIRRNIYKNISGNKLIFEEINFDLSISYQYSWLNCDRFGFIKKSKILNNNNDSVLINILDGIRNILPYGADRKFQLEYSTLLDGYKKNELVNDLGLGLFTLSSIPIDKAEPSEALKATIVWSTGLENASVLLSSKQINLFKKGKPVTQESVVKGTRGAYLLQSDFELLPGDDKEWYIAADVNKDQSDVAEISSLLVSKQNLKQQIEDEIKKSSIDLNIKIANADGFQLTNDTLITSRHFSNVIFNIMRGGVFDNNYLIDKKDFSQFVKKANCPLWERYSAFFKKLPLQLNIFDLINEVKNLHDPDLEKLSYEYLPLTFSRRHGDPSRPWNLFSIDVKDEHGDKVLNYQGNWRDIFQNWEALALSFPSYVENMIIKFVNASTADGYNPYKITRDGFDWEVLDPADAWSYIGYWGDHQVIYLLRLLELSVKYHPEALHSFLIKEIFAFANVPYKIRSYREIVENPHNTVEFDFGLDAEIRRRVKEIGTDGKYLQNKESTIYRVNLAEKLLIVILIKLSNFIPEAGIWMNTQRPEWNDANNALVGFGASMVTLYYLRRFIRFCAKLFREAEYEQIEISEEVLELFVNINQAMMEFRYLLKEEITNDNRKKILDRLGTAGSNYRLKIYSDGFSSRKKFIQIGQLKSFFQTALDYLDHSIRANIRDNDLYHSYNLIKFRNQKEICISNLYEMLEGQVAVLNSGYLSAGESIDLLSSLQRSKLYRKDQYSYLLYPDRSLSPFTEKNIIPKELLVQSQFLQDQVHNNDKHIVIRDVNGNIHFNSKFRNAAKLKQTLNNQMYSNKLTGEEKESILNIYETVFNHRAFTGRSGTFYKYEGLGCIYWHMVSKLLLAVQETFNEAEKTDGSTPVLKELKDYYYEIRKGIGSHKSPELYGAFPIDPYSHTPGNMGVQQPGMTGQVKEDIISRFGELGVLIRNGKIQFNPGLLNKNEFLNKSQIFRYYDLDSNHQTLMLDTGMLAFTLCQVPVIYIISKDQKIIITKKVGIEEEITGLTLERDLSRMIFRREGIISKIKVLINNY